jgi:hypothetical protein
MATQLAAVLIFCTRLCCCCSLVAHSELNELSAQKTPRCSCEPTLLSATASRVARAKGGREKPSIPRGRS